MLVFLVTLGKQLFNLMTQKCYHLFFWLWTCIATIIMIIIIVVIIIAKKIFFCIAHRFKCGKTSKSLIKTLWKWLKTKKHKNKLNFGLLFLNGCFWLFCSSVYSIWKGFQLIGLLMSVPGFEPANHLVAVCCFIRLATESYGLR